MVIFLLQVKPFESPLATKIEVFNESTLVVLSYGLMMFTDFVPRPEDRYIIGWYYLTGSLINIMMHISRLIHASYKVIARKVR